MLDSITGEEVTRIPLGDAFRKKFKHPYALIHRADLHKVLLDACQQSDLIRLDASQKVVAVDETGDGITARTESGKTYRRRGADRRRRAVVDHPADDRRRRQAESSPATSPIAPCCRHRKCRSNFRWRDMVVWAGEKVHLVHYPLRTGELFNLVAVFHSNRYEEGWDSYGDPAELHERFAKTCEPVRTLLGKIESWRMWVLCDRPPIKDWSRGRITLLGDAAHPMLQYLAQGACMAIEDAVCLAERGRGGAGRLRGGVPRLSGRRAICAPAACRSWRASMASSITPPASPRELRNMMLGARTPEDAMAGMEWLYGEQTELTRGARVKMLASFRARAARARNR